MSNSGIFVREDTCPVCGKAISHAFSEDAQKAPPTPGDILFCSGCLSPNRYGKDMKLVVHDHPSLKPLTEEETEAAMTGMRRIAIVQAIRNLREALEGKAQEVMAEGVPETPETKEEGSEEGDPLQKLKDLIAGMK